MKKVLVVVDYQNDFVIGKLGFHKALLLENPICDHIAEVLRNGYEVFFTMDMHDAKYLQSREGKNLPIPHCLRGSEGAKLYGRAADFLNSPHVHTVAKSTFGAKDLPILIKEVCGNVDEIEICGVVTNLCVISNAVVLQSHFKNAEIKVLAKLCASNVDALHEKAIDVMRNLQFRII